MKKQSQFKKRAKMDVNIYSTKDYENEPRLRPAGKQTQYARFSVRELAYHDLSLSMIPFRKYRP